MRPGRSLHQRWRQVLRHTPHPHPVMGHRRHTQVPHNRTSLLKPCWRRGTGNHPGCRCSSVTVGPTRGDLQGGWGAAHDCVMCDMQQTRLLSPRFHRHTGAHLGRHHPASGLCFLPVSCCLKLRQRTLHGTPPAEKDTHTRATDDGWHAGLRLAL